MLFDQFNTLAYKDVIGTAKYIKKQLKIYTQSKNSKSQIKNKPNIWNVKILLLTTSP